MDNNLRNLCEQIQEDILAYAASGVDVDVFPETALDQLCEIVVQNFRKFDPEGDFAITSGESLFVINHVEFDISPADYEFWQREEGLSEDDLKAKLESEWKGRTVGPVLEEEVIDHISDLSGWCVSCVGFNKVK